MAAKIKKGDHVVVIAGKDKGSKGEVLKVFPKESRLLVKGVRLVKRHVKPSQGDPDGGIRLLRALFIYQMSLSLTQKVGNQQELDLSL